MDSRAKSNYYILIIALIIGFIVLALGLVKNKNTICNASSLDNKKYLVQDLDDKDEASYLLSVVRRRIFIICDYLLKNIDKYPQYSTYIKQFCDRIQNIVLKENTANNKFTSYTVNKGDEMVLCLRSNKTGDLHDINLIMYVVIHELAHIACPEINHTPLFTELFIFYLKIAIDLGVYNKVNYQINPKEYCGITIQENILK